MLPMFGDGTTPDAWALGDTVLDKVFVGNEQIFPVPGPLANGISPSTGPSAGGTTITLTGQYFRGTMSVTVDGVAATNLNVISDTLLTFTLPARAAGAGTVDVIVSNVYGSSTWPFTYFLGAAYREDFPIDSTTGWGSDWTTQSGSPSPRIQSGVAVMGSLGNGSSGFCYARYFYRPLTDNVMAKVKVVKPPNQAQASDNELIIALRGNDNFSGSGARNVCFVMWPGSCAIMLNVNGTLTSKASGGAVAVNSEIHCICNGNVYTLYNATLQTTLATWTDSAGDYADYAGNRYMHMYQEGNYPFFQQAYGSYGADWIEYMDI